MLKATSLSAGALSNFGVRVVVSLFCYSKDYRARLNSLQSWEVFMKFTVVGVYLFSEESFF